MKESEIMNIKDKTTLKYELEDFLEDCGYTPTGSSKFVAFIEKFIELKLEEKN